MSADLVPMILAGAMAGGFINGLAGFGTSLFALGWWLQVVPPVQAVAMALVVSVVTGVQGVALVRRSIVWPRFATFFVPALVGIPAGLVFLHSIDAEALKIVLAVFLIAYGGFFTLRRNLPSLTRPYPLVDAVVGLLGGFMGAVAGLSGALPTMWLALRDWPKEATRAVLQPFNVGVLGLSAIVLAVNGTYDRGTLIAIAVALPVSIGSAQLGIALFNRIATTTFRRLIIAMMFLSGAVILVREVV